MQNIDRASRNLAAFCLLMLTPVIYHNAMIRRCEKEEDLAMIAAQQYYIEYGTEMNAERLFGLLPNYIPDYCLQTDNALDTWNGLILQAYKKVGGL